MRPISRWWNLEDCLRTSHLDVPNRIEQVLRYGRIHSPEQIRKDIERTARTLADPFADKFGKGTASSWYRCLALNAVVRGQANSAHTVGLAFDWEPAGVSIAAAIIWAMAQPKEELPFDRLIVEERAEPVPGGKTKWLHVQAADEGLSAPRAVYLLPGKRRGVAPFLISRSARRGYMREDRTYGGVLTRPAAVVVATLVAIGAVATLGWKAHDLVTSAQASEVPADIRKDIAEIKIAIGKINCRLNIEGTCPEPPPVRTSGVSR